MCLLQMDWAAEQTELFPPLLHAMIYTLLNTCNSITGRKS